MPQALTSYGGLELLGRYLRQIDLGARLRQTFAGLRSDYGGTRIEHLRYLGGDPLVTRFCGLARLPTRRTVADWLRQFTQETLAPLVALNRDLVTEALARLDLPRLTIDVDGSVIRTEATVGWAFRGFSPHHRKDPSYYPLVAHVAETGHILRLKNRPGNVHDSTQAAPFLRELIDDLRGRFGRRVALEFRMDAAFFQRGILHLLAARECGYAIKVGYWSWLPLKAITAGCCDWQPVAPGVTGHETELVIPQWHDLRLRVVLYRKHVGDQTRKNFQLDLFTPDDGHYEYSRNEVIVAVANTLSVRTDSAGLHRARRKPSTRLGVCHRRRPAWSPDVGSPVERLDHLSTSDPCAHTSIVPGLSRDHGLLSPCPHLRDPSDVCGNGRQRPGTTRNRRRPPMRYVSKSAWSIVKTVARDSR
ncbi:MAG: transposase [Candidatus Rokubacteria bacterium]|nr:transposase [Candidatus Rokubacteria bacterium]